VDWMRDEHCATTRTPDDQGNGGVGMKVECIDDGALEKWRYYI
jgi:hypothetical protein